MSVCSPQAFKDTVKLTDRAGEHGKIFLQSVTLQCVYLGQSCGCGYSNGGGTFGTQLTVFLPLFLLAVQLQIAFAPLIGRNSIQYSAGTDWEDRRRCLYPVFKGETLESYYPHFVNIAQVNGVSMVYSLGWRAGWGNLKVKFYARVEPLGQDPLM